MAATSLSVKWVSTIYCRHITNNCFSQTFRLKFSLFPGKWWGDQNVQPVLALHGLCDNCATFDGLLPLIDAPSVLAIDLPGHGLSSHTARGLMNSFPQMIISLRYLLKNHFGWSKVDFLAHSFGSCTAFVYSGLFPRSVRKLISIDCARFNMAVKGRSVAELLKLGTCSSLRHENEKRPEKTFDEHLKDFMELREKNGYGLTDKAARSLLSRILTELPTGKYAEAADPRLPLIIGILPMSSLDEIAVSLTCEVLTIRFTSGVFQNWREAAYNKQLDMMKTTSSNLIAVDVPGGHHTHLESPETVASHINYFLQS